MAIPAVFFRCVALLGAVIVGGCVSPAAHRLVRQSGESMVFVGEEPSMLAFVPEKNSPLQLRSTYLPGPSTIYYQEGRDYQVDYARGTIRRVPGSRLPDFRGNILYGKREFDHTKFPGFGNAAFFAFVDYSIGATVTWPVQSPQSERLRATRAKLTAGGPVKILAFGDSITAGGDATAPSLIFWRRWADGLQAKYPRSQITAVNVATGGHNTTRGLQVLKEKVLDAAPDLVLIGFGMNDHNRRGVTPPDFARQLREMIDRIRATTAAEIVLLSTFPPNPNWMHSSNRMADYAAATARVAEESGCAYADVFNNWNAMTTRKRPEDILANNINHPNDFGHWIYFRVLEAMEL